MSMPTLTVYSAPDCCLCDEAHAELDVIGPELGIDVVYVDISGDAKLEAAHRTELPVGYMDGRKVFKYHVNREQLARRARMAQSPAGR